MVVNDKKKTKTSQRWLRVITDIKMVSNNSKISKNEPKWAVSLKNERKVSRTVGNGSGYGVRLENKFKNMKNGSQMIKND